MSIYNPPQMNGTGVDEILVDITRTIPIFTPMFLFFIYVTVFITGYRKQRLSGSVTGGDAPLWATIAGVITSMTALIMSTRVGLINIATLTVVIVITIFSAIWLFSSRDR